MLYLELQNYKKRFEAGKGKKRVKKIYEK